jgi:DNA-binding NarL/FixJ family response regulator
MASQTLNSHPSPHPPADRRPIHVLLVDDHPEVRHGLRRLLADEPDMVTIGESGAASVQTSQLARWTDVAVVDYHLGDRDGLWLTEQIKRQPFRTRVLIYSAFADEPLAVAAILAGADGLLSKATLSDELCVAIRRLVGGHQYFPAVAPPVSAALASRLGRRDRSIFSMLMHGVPVGEIAVRLLITPSEVEERRHAIRRELAPANTRDRILAAARAPLDYDRAQRRPRFPPPA